MHVLAIRTSVGSVRVDSCSRICQAPQARRCGHYASQQTGRQESLNRAAADSTAFVLAMHAPGRVETDVVNEQYWDLGYFGSRGAGAAVCGDARDARHEESSACHQA